MPASPLGTTSTLFGYKIPLDRWHNTYTPRTHLDVASGEQLGEFAVQAYADLALVEEMHVSVGAGNELVLRDPLLVDGHVEHDDQRAAGREDVVRQVLRILQRDGVVGDLDWFGGDRPRRALDGGGRERAVDDVRCAD